jgi:hypothetical protein
MLDYPVSIDLRCFGRERFLIFECLTLVLTNESGAVMLVIRVCRWEVRYSRDVERQVER